MGKIYVGIDNGVSGTISIINMHGDSIFLNTPTFSQQSYTKTKQNITRIDVKALKALIENNIHDERTTNVFVMLERPMINPGRFKASISAARSLEAILTVIEDLNIPYSYCDSKEWQKMLLPAGLVKDELKKASLDIGNRLFPQHTAHKHKDRDSLLIAEFARRKNY